MEKKLIKIFKETFKISNKEDLIELKEKNLKFMTNFSGNMIY